MIDYSDWNARNRRLDVLLASVPLIINLAIWKYVTGFRDGKGRGRELTGIVTMFSGGNDSTVLAHMMRNLTTHYAHGNTGIGIEGTRDFVRKTCADWDVPLLERSPAEGRTFDEYVSRHGFPGPGRHGHIYARIKGSPFEQINKIMCPDPYSQRVLFIGGRRMLESGRRERRKIPVIEHRKSIVWVSPLRGWTKFDLRTYRERFPDCPVNPIAEHLGMSGECLCGAFAKPGELDQLRRFPPAADAVEQIGRLSEVARSNGVAERRCRWGWGASVFTPCENGCNV